MSFVIHGGRNDPTLEYDVTDAASGAPARVTILTGTLAIVFQRKGFIEVHSKADAAHTERLGTFVVGMNPLPPGPEPVVVAEMFLSQVAVYDGDLKGTFLHGVGEVAAQVMPDPQRGGQRFVYLSFTCVGKETMALRYRITVYRAR
ncbi:MAG: hypothetical protein U0414_07315 [Polyangiaceae bacterium]